MKATVIIPTRNRANMLDACLQSLAAQTMPADQFEVIVVDNGSTDNTPHIINHHQATLQLRGTYEPEPGLHIGRHAGLRLARSEVLVFGDDDIVAKPTWLTSITRAFEDSNVALVGGNNLPLFEHSPPAWLSRWWESPTHHGRALSHLSILDFGQGQFDIDPHFIWGCNFSIRRRVLLDAGGFHPDGMPTERLAWRGDGETYVSEWIRHSGLRARFDSGASVCHRVTPTRMTPHYFAQRGYSQGISDSYSDIRRRGRHALGGIDHLRRRMLTEIRRLRLRIAPPMDATDAQLKQVKLGTLDAWKKGYDFHQSAVRNDPILFDWVTRETYL